MAADTKGQAGEEGWVICEDLQGSKGIHFVDLLCVSSSSFRVQGLTLRCLIYFILNFGQVK